jgi:hypothetical protein
MGIHQSLESTQPESLDAIWECVAEQYFEPNTARSVDTFLSHHRQFITPIVRRSTDSDNGPKVLRVLPTRYVWWARACLGQASGNSLDDAGHLDRRPEREAGVVVVYGAGAGDGQYPGNDDDVGWILSAAAGKDQLRLGKIQRSFKRGRATP